MTPDGQAICDTLRDAARRIGWVETGRRCRHDRTALYRAFSGIEDGRQPSFRTVTEVAHALGFRIVLVPAADVPPTISEE